MVLSNTNYTITASPIVHYQFGCDKNAHAEIVKSGPFMEALSAPNKHPPLCHLSSNGIVSSESSLQSNDPIQEFQAVSANASAFAIELWMTVVSPEASAMDVSLPILSFRDPRFINNNHDNEGDTADECVGFPVALLQRGLHLELRYIDQIGTQNVCRILIISQQVLNPDTLQQIVVIWRNSNDTNIYLNGDPVVQGAPNHFDTTLSLWNPMTMLELFGTPIFRGSLNMLSIYNENLTDRDIVELWRQGASTLTTALRNREPLHIRVPQGPHVQLLPQGDQAASVEVGKGVVFDAGNSTATQDWSLLVEIIGLPFFGSLFGTDGKSPLEERQQLWLDNDDDDDDDEGRNKSLVLWYCPKSKDFFNAPNFSYNGTSLNSHREFFTYRLLAVPRSIKLLSQDTSEAMLDTDELVLATSEVVQQELIVIHVNHPPLLKVPGHATVEENPPTGIKARPRAYLQNVQVLDAADFGIDRIRVDLWAQSGTLSIADKDLLPLADFASCRASERLALLGTQGAVTWSCYGNGLANRNMTFLATPDDASKILSHVEYNGFHWDQADLLVLRVSDGVDGSCLSNQEHQLGPNRSLYRKYNTIHNNQCFQVVAEIPVLPISSAKDFASGSVGGYLKALFDVGDFGWADGIFWGFVVLAISACCLCLRTCIQCCGARRSKIHIEDESKERVEVAKCPAHDREIEIV